MNKISISVVLSANNEAPVIDNVIKAIPQHIPTAEMVIVGDGLTDDTAAIAEEVSE